MSQRTFKLKNYQRQALSALGSFLKEARLGDVATAFNTVRKEQGFDKPQNYREYSFGQVPYVCLRLPTGGGKTVLASHAIKIATHSYLEKDFPITLWLVPTKIIKEQTLESLKKPGHPYRIELDRAFDYQVKVLDIEEVNLIRPQDIGSKAIVVVSTMASLRVSETSGRNVYAYHEDFEPHFTKVNKEDTRLERVSETDVEENGLSISDVGKIKYSFVNLLALNNPLVIVDEAHNARTGLTFETLQRVHPAAIIELTATPDISSTSASNVLYHVSASELKAEQMIKLPIMLTEHDGWQSSVRDAVLTQKKLLIVANKENDYVRPIVLFQAEPKNGLVTVEMLKKFLMDELEIDEIKIAIATGKQRDLDGLDLFDKSCPIEYIITIEALKEGWDCSFAYVFCSVKPVRSAKDAEQLLGRVLRMPYAERRQQEELNRAYAHLSSPSFSQAAKDLADQLVHMGFEAVELASTILPGGDDLFDDHTGPVIRAGSVPLVLKLPHDETVIEAAKLLNNNVIVTSEDESCRVEVKDFIAEENVKTLLKLLKGKQKKEVQVAVDQHNQRLYAIRSPSEQGLGFAQLPMLFFPIQGELELLEKETFFHLKEWSLLDFEVTLSQFSLTETSTTFELDVQGKKISYRIAEERSTYDLNLVDGGFTETELVRWLDKELRQPDISQSDLVAYLSKLVSHLTKERTIPLTGLFRSKFILANCIANQLTILRNKVADSNFQKVLFEESDQLETRFDFSYEFLPGLYPARAPYYQGRYQFVKHYYPILDDLKENGEEFECAQAIDRDSRVKFWVRNLVNREQASFSLPLAGRNFYPDFVAELNDGRLMVIEYKGDIYRTNDDSREKNAVGEMWAKKSQGKCLFLMAEKRDSEGRDVYQQINMLISN